MADVTSWMAESVEDKPTAWTHERVSNPVNPKKVREMNKRLRTIYNEAGLEYGEDVLETELVERFKVAVDLRKTNVKGVLKSIRDAKNVEVCFLIDATGSMQDHINGVKNSINQIVALLKQPKAAAPPTLTSRRKKSAGAANKLRLSIIAYRDFCDAEQFKVLNFTEDVGKFQTFCAELQATGGGDGPEDVFGGFAHVFKLGWSDECGTKVVFHIADAPCHGNRYHNSSMTDDYPEGDPKGMTEKQIFSDLEEEGIDYYFGAVIPSVTNRMITMFSDACGKKITQFNVREVQAITDSVFTAVSTSIFFSNKAKEIARKTRFYKLDPAYPFWPCILKFSGRFLDYKYPASILDVVNDVPLERNPPRHAIVQIASSPFAHGAERYAFYGQDVTNPSKPEAIVLKEYILIGSGNPAARYECTNQVQTIASFFAEKYNAVFRKNVGFHYFIKFLKVQTLCLPISGTEARYLSCEKQYKKDDVFVRFTNNADFEMNVESAQKQKVDIDFVWALTAFSHWTYHVTGGKLMVVDLQGVITEEDDEDSATAVLTDPAIHCIDETRFGRMNLGQEGMEIFFNRHDCNKYCEALKLNPVVVCSESKLP